MSRLEGILNEAGDLVSEIALFMPLMFVPPFSAEAVGVLIALVVASELAGIAPTMAGGERRLEGPLGKVDRSIILSVIALVIAVSGRLPESASILVPALSVGVIATIGNRKCRYPRIRGGPNNANRAGVSTIAADIRDSL